MKLKKLIALILSVLCVLSLVSCSKDDGVPEGMKKISDDSVAYDFYVYTEWLVDDNVTDCAYFSETDRSNVSMTSYFPSENHVTVQDFYNSTIETYKRDFNDFTLLEEGKAKMGMFDAYEIVYTFRFGEQIFKVYQTMTLRGSIMYIFTYTSSPDIYESHLGAVKNMLGELKFRA